jgi:quercetin dioxygenase-like cupin family protein
MVGRIWWRDIMRLVQYTDVEGVKVGKGAEGVEIRWLIDEKDGGKNFCMRHFDISPGGHTPHHQHEWEHEIFILEGEGEVVSGETPHPFRAGDAILMPGGEKHQFRNTGQTPVRLLCLIPARDKGAC